MHEGEGREPDYYTCCLWCCCWYCAPLYVESNPIPAATIGFNFYVRWPFLFWGFFLLWSSSVCLGTESLFYTLTVHIIIIPLSRWCTTPCHVCLRYSSSISQLVFTLRDFGNFIVGLMEFFNTPELFVNYNWIISALFGEFRHSRRYRVGGGGVEGKWMCSPLRTEVLFYPHEIICAHLCENYKVWI